MFEPGNGSGPGSGQGIGNGLDLKVMRNQGEAERYHDILGAIIQERFCVFEV